MLHTEQEQVLLKFPSSCTVEGQVVPPEIPSLHFSLRTQHSPDSVSYKEESLLPDHCLSSLSAGPAALGEGSQKQNTLSNEQKCASNWLVLKQRSKESVRQRAKRQSLICGFTTWAHP